MRQPIRSGLIRDTELNSVGRIINVVLLIDGAALRRDFIASQGSPTRRTHEIDSLSPQAINRGSGLL